MTIGIDARFAVHNRRGMGNYTLKLIQNLAEIDSHNEYILYIDKDDSKGVLPKQKNFRVKKLWPSNYLVWEQVVLPLQAKKDKLDILHCTGNTAPLYMDKHIRLVSSIMDVMYLKDYSVLPKSSSTYQKFGRIYRKIVVPGTIKNVSKVITISNFSKDDILKHIPNLNKEKINVIYLASNERFHYINDRNDAFNKIKAKLGIKDNYIFNLGGADPRKNTELVIKIYIELRNEKKIMEKLVITGIPNWKQTGFFDMVNKSSCRDDIIFTDFVTEEDLVLLYNCASVFLYPSLYEGFGIPPLEAMACGVPVITSNTTSIPEIVGDAALLVNPRDGGEIGVALLKLLNDEVLRKDFIRRGFEQVKRFSWHKMAKETLAVYESLERQSA